MTLVRLESKILWLAQTPTEDNATFWDVAWWQQKRASKPMHTRRLHTALFVKFHALFFKHATLAGEFLAVAVAIESAEGEGGADDAMTGDAGREGIATQGLADGLVRPAMQLAGDEGIRADLPLGDGADEIIHAGLEGSGRTVRHGASLPF